jgi:hypothetical protein
MSTVVTDLYDAAILPARERFASAPGVAALQSPDLTPEFMESYLIQFSSLGVALTQPVEDWLRRAGDRCKAIGLDDIAKAFYTHVNQEKGHHLMMIADTHALVARWNAHRRPRLDANELLDRPPTPGGRMYQQIHEDVNASDAPFAQIAIEYEIEMLPVRYGQAMIDQCLRLLGPEVIECLSFLKSHIVLDVGHTEFNKRHLARLLESNPRYVDPLVRAGGAALEAYATFIADCVQLAGEQCEVEESKAVAAG